MIDLNYSLRIAYTTALSPKFGPGRQVGLYYLNAPPTDTASEYIIMYGLQSIDSSTNASCDVILNISFALYSFADIVNEGLDSDIIIRDFFRLVYPNPQFNLTMDGAQIVTTELANDIEQPGRMVNGRLYKQRNIALRHFIYERSDIS